MKTERVGIENHRQRMTSSAVCYGECRNSPPYPTDKLFTGQRLDSNGLYYYGTRYYDPMIGRFISADIVVQSFANPQTLNRYSYVVNNPLKYIDPSGLDAVLVLGAGQSLGDFNEWQLDAMCQELREGLNLGESERTVIVGGSDSRALESEITSPLQSLLEDILPTLSDIKIGSMEKSNAFENMLVRAEDKSGVSISEYWEYRQNKPLIRVEGLNVKPGYWQTSLLTDNRIALSPSTPIAVNRALAVAAVGTGTALIVGGAFVAFLGAGIPASLPMFGGGIAFVDRGVNMWLSQYNKQMIIPNPFVP